MDEDEIVTMETAMIGDLRVLESIILQGRLVRARREGGTWCPEARAVSRLLTELRHVQRDEDKARRKTSSRIDHSDRIIARNEARRHEAFMAREVIAL